MSETAMGHLTMRKIDQVALAISKAAYPDVHPDFTDAGWQRMAEAALDALVDPDEEMVLAALDARKKYGLMSSQANPVLEFNSMISAARK